MVTYFSSVPVICSLTPSRSVQERMVVHLLVVFAGHLVEAQLDVRDFARDRVDRGEGPAGELGHGLGGVDALGAGGLVDRQRVAAAEAFRLRRGFRLFVPRRSGRTTAPLA